MLESLSVVTWVSISLNQVKSIECIVLFGMKNYKKQKEAAVVPVSNLLHHIMICYNIMQLTIMQLIITGWHSRWAVCRRLDLCIENRPAGVRGEREREREREQMADKQSAGAWIFAYKTGLQVASHSYLAHAHICTGVEYAVICSIVQYDAWSFQVPSR